MPLLFITLLATCASAPQAPAGEEVIRAMHERYAETWYRTLTFVQKTTNYGADGTVAQVETWYESLELPGRLRIDVVPLDGGRILLFRSDTLYSFQGGQASAPRPLVHGLLVMGFDVYHQPVEETVEKLEGLGVDLSRTYETTWQGRDVWVVGATEGDETSNQFWVDKERLVFVRQLSGQREVRFNRYEPLGGGWIAPEVAIYQGGALRTLEEYSDMDVGMTFEDGVFDPERLVRPGWIAGEAPTAALPHTWVEPVTGMELVLVEPGAFAMGLAADPKDIRPAPVHRVEITRPFYMGRFEVTQGQWEAVMGNRPSQGDACPRCPVESISWWDVRDFLARLEAAQPGERFRLPTEAEWEMACRAGQGGRYGAGVDTLTPELANYDGGIPFEGVTLDSAPGRPLPVGSYPANPWGLHDLQGNVWEWTEDEYCPYGQGPATDPVARCGTDTVAIRGGSWHFSANAARCGRRYTHARGDSGFSLGFRVVREVLER